MLTICLCVIGTIILLAIERSIIIAHVDTVAAEIHDRITTEFEKLQEKL